MTQYFTAVQERLLTLVHVPLSHTLAVTYTSTRVHYKHCDTNYDDTTGVISFGVIAITEGEGFEPPGRLTQLFSRQPP